MPDRLSRRIRRWGPALIPVLVGGLFWAAARAGLLADDRVRVALSARLADWWLALGILLSALLCGLTAVAVRAEAARRRALSEQAAAAARDRRRLLSRLDHELKNPLTAMRAAVANVSGSGPGADRDAGLRSIDEQVVRLSRLTTDLRKIADVEFRGMDRGPVDVAALLEEAVEVIREQPAARHRDLSVDVPRAPWPLPQISGDWDLLSLAVVKRPRTA